MSVFSMPLVSYFADSTFKSNLNVTYKTSQTTKNGLKVLPDSILSGDDLLLKNKVLSHKKWRVFRYDFNRIISTKERLNTF